MESRRKVEIEIGDGDKDREHAPVKVQKRCAASKKSSIRAAAGLQDGEAAWGSELGWTGFNQPAACDEPTWTLYFGLFICLYPKRRRRFSAGSR